MHFSRRLRSMIRVGGLESGAQDGVSDAIELGRRTLSRPLQLRILAAIAGAIVLTIFVCSVPAAMRAVAAGHDAPIQETAAPDTFMPSAAQLRSLVISPVTAAAFRSEEVAEGTIAVDDDLSTPVFSPYSGRVLRLNARLGDVVAKGAPLMTVEASEFGQAQNDLAAAAGAADAARGQLAVTVRNEQRLHDLFGVKGAALKDWQQAEADVTSAQSAARGAAATLAAVRNRLRILGKTDSEIDALAHADGAGPVSAATVMTAPIGGTVIQRQVGLGQYIQASAASPVFAIGDLSRVWLVANVREADAPQIHPGQTVEVRVAAYADKVFTARVTTVGPAIDPATHRLPVRAEIDNADGALTPQMFATFRIVTSDTAMAPAVPEGAVISEGSASRVWVAGADGGLKLRKIRIGRTNGGQVEVTDGLAVGEKVVTAGALFIDRAVQAD
jgi:cobalt-zinc-cadmium efflux system membrane fusion protein